MASSRPTPWKKDFHPRRFGARQGPSLEPSKQEAALIKEGLEQAQTHCLLSPLAVEGFVRSWSAPEKAFHERFGPQDHHEESDFPEMLHTI